MARNSFVHSTLKSAPIDILIIDEGCDPEGIALCREKLGTSLDPRIYREEPIGR